MRTDDAGGARGTETPRVPIVGTKAEKWDPTLLPVTVGDDPDDRLRFDLLPEKRPDARTDREPGR